MKQQPLGNQNGTKTAWKKPWVRLCPVPCSLPSGGCNTLIRLSKLQEKSEPVTLKNRTEDVNYSQFIRLRQAFLKHFSMLEKSDILNPILL